MTDLATRIADARKKAEKAKSADAACKDAPKDNIPAMATLVGNWFEANSSYNEAASPSLFIEMADEIDRLTAQLEKAREALEPFAKEWEANWEGFHNYTDDDDLSLDEMKGSDLTASHLRTAARAHAELK